MRVKAQKRKNMTFEQSKADQEKDFSFAADKADKRELEKKFELEIKQGDVDKIIEETEKEKNEAFYGSNHDNAQTIAFNGARLNKLKEILPEIDISGNKITDEDWESIKERFKQDVHFTVEQMKKFSNEKRYAHLINLTEKESKLEQNWPRAFITSDMKNLDPERFKKDSEMQVSSESWKNMIDYLKSLFEKNNYSIVIEMAGRMNDLKPQEFKDEVAGLFTEDRRKGILENISKSQEGGKGKGPDYGEFAKKVRFVSEFLPDLLSEIEISEDYWRGMKEYLDGKKSAAEHNGKEYRNVVDAMLNTKTIEKLIKKGKIEIK